jgi:5-oxoprolinase (ATP-hydrolysing)
LKAIKAKDVDKGKSHSQADIYFDGGRLDTSVFKLDDLAVGDKLQGPAILVDGTQTLVVPPGSSALVIETHVVINIGDESSQQ